MDIIVKPDLPNTEVEREDHYVDIQLGTWYWVNDSDGTSPAWLGCVVKIGSNFVKFEGVGDSGYMWTRRIHLDEFEKECKFCPNSAEVIKGKVTLYKNQVDEKMGEVKKILQSLGIESTPKLGHISANPGSQQLAVLSNVDVDGYKAALLDAKDEQLPTLFKEIDKDQQIMVLWMKCTELELTSQLSILTDKISDVNKRVHSITLYAGLTEEVVQVRDGVGAGIDSKLHFHQRMLFMDEESLVGYERGGLEFRDIVDFDRWLAKPSNFTRVLPHDKCAVAFRVRRKEKDRVAYDISTALMNMMLRQSDKITFLYIRDGERLHRLNCDFSFGEKLFPDSKVFDVNEPLMFRMFIRGSVDGFITKREWEVMKRDDEERDERNRLEREAWFAANPYEEWKAKQTTKNVTEADWRWHAPYRFGSSSRLSDYHELNRNSVYYDEAMGKLKSDIEHFNDVAVIFQGLLDRTKVFGTCPPINLHSGKGMDHVVFVTDFDNVLLHGDKPDIQAYIERCNALADEHSVFFGQQRYWREKEAQKENARNARSWRTSNMQEYTEFEPYGNPGPGMVAKCAKYSSRTKKATFRWERERQTDGRGGYYGDPIPTSITVPLEELFNISAYKLGDYLQFFNDPRTRVEYAQWANMLLHAEQYWLERMNEK